MISVALVIIAVACLATTYRMTIGPTDSDRVVAADLLLFGVVGMIALFGILLGNPFTFDIVLIATLVGFLSALSLARALMRGKR